MKKTNQSRMADNYTSMSWGCGDKLYASDLTKMSRQVDSNENELVDLTTTTIPKIVSDVASNKSTLDEFAPKVAKIDVPEGSTIVKEIDKAVADLVNGAPETLDTIKEVADAIEQNGDAIDALNDIVTKNKVAIDSVDAEQKATAEKLATLDSKAVKYQEFGEDRKTIQLANYDTISGVTTKGLGVNLVMVSKWNKVDLGSSQVSMNLNSLDGQVTINDGKVVATLDDISGSETATNALIDKKIADYHKESDAKFVSAKTTGQHSTVAVSTADDEVRLSSSETNPTGSQGGVYVGSQLIQVMTNYKPSDRKEASLLMITPSRFDLKRCDAEGQMHEIELVDLITKANKVPGVEAGVEAVKKRVETLGGEVNTKTPLESFEAFKTETNGEIQKVKSNVLQLSNSVYTKSEIDGKLTGAFHYKGSVETYADLPTQDQVIGDVYNVEDTGMNVAWDGKKWDNLGSVINLTPYATTEAVEAKITETKQAASEALNQHAQTAETTYAKKAEVTKQIEAVDGKFAGKADKVHTHTIENITGLQDALDGKQAVGDYALKSEVKTVDDKFAGYTTTEALNGLLDGKAAVVHTHTVDNVTGLQAALDAKMAASEAAKFATHDHNHDQAYLAIKGKAESAKVADSVAWTNVTGTETIAVKSEVEAVDAKFASYTTTAALAAEYATKQALADGLKAKAEAAHTHVAADITDLQDKLDAKLDVGGKAESAKVADSVAWTNVTGTEGVALKSDLDSKMEASEASKFAQASHVHAIENVTGLQQALNDKIAVADADGKYALKSAITGLATKEELNGKAAASHTHQEGEVEGLTAKLATFALKSEIAGFVTDEALKRDYTNTADLGQLLDSKLDTTAGDKKYATKTEVNSIVEAAVKAPVFVNIPLRPEPNYTETAIANWFGCETIEQVGQVITGDKVVYLHFTSTGKDYKIPVQYCAFKADGSNDIILMTVGLDTANDEVCKYKITIALNSDSSTVDVNKTPLVSPAA